MLTLIPSLTFTNDLTAWEPSSENNKDIYYTEYIGTVIQFNYK